MVPESLRGVDKTGDVAQSGARAIGGAEIGRARNVNGLPVLPAIIPLSDGQTISILFHSPTAENRITNSDTLVAFQFLLNKKRRYSHRCSDEWT